MNYCRLIVVNVTIRQENATDAYVLKLQCDDNLLSNS